VAAKQPANTYRAKPSHEVDRSFDMRRSISIYYNKTRERKGGV